MMEQILARENLQRAWHRVRSNAGAPGVDGMSIAAFPAFCRERWPAIRSALMRGTYRPAPVRRVFIPKPDGSQRPLGVPTVLDRVIPQALAQVLKPLFEGGVLSFRSFGSPAVTGTRYRAAVSHGDRRPPLPFQSSRGLSERDCAQTPAVRIVCRPGLSA